MIQFTRRWAKDVLAVLKKVFRGSNAALPPVLLRAGPEGLVVRVQARGFSVQYQDSEPREACELVVPARAFEDTAGAKSEPASFYHRRDGVFGASWEERGLTRQLEYPAAIRSEEPFPTPPERLAANPARLRQALANACDVTDVTSSRYALGCLQLRGERGDLCATDGRQLLMQRGFAWGFEDTALLPATKLFAAKELESESDILIGRTEKHLYLRFGPWSFWLPLELEARFPIVDNILPPASNAKTVLELSSADARFLIDNLHRLPGSTFERKVTLDLNGSVAIRARTDDTPQGVEMVLRSSTKSGSDVRIGIDRRYLARAAGMGFDRIYLSDPATAMLAEDATRSYLWMPLDDSNLLGPSADFIRLESPLGGPTAERRYSANPQHNKPMSTTPKSPPATPIVKKPAARLPQTAGGASLDQALQVRDALRAQLAAVKELVRTLRSERQGRRRLKSTLASLKNLQQVA